MADVKTQQTQNQTRTEERRHRTWIAAWRIGRPYPVGPRVEDPIRIAQMATRLQGLSWKPDKQDSSLAVLFDCITELTLAEIRYYYGRRLSARRLSRALRVAAWLFGTAALLAPIVRPLWVEAPAEFLSWGYLGAALGAAVLVADSVFAGSQAHRRCVETQISLERLYEVFALEWQLLRITFESSESRTRAEPLVRKVIDFCNSLHDCLGVETRAWTIELEKARAELTRLARVKQQE